MCRGTRDSTHAQSAFWLLTQGRIAYTKLADITIYFRLDDDSDDDADARTTCLLIVEIPVRHRRCLLP